MTEEKGVPRPITRGHIIDQALKLRKLAGDGRDDLSREANRTAGLLIEIAGEYPTEIEEEYHRSDPFPPRARAEMIRILELFEPQEGAYPKAQELIEKIRSLPHRTNQMLWEHLGGHGPAPEHFRPGYDALWEWFGLSYASFLVIPRVLMHKMPDEWQGTMARLLKAYSGAFSGAGLEGTPLEGLHTSVGFKVGNRFVEAPRELCNYRHPQTADLEKYR